jgi:hypothetical protein
MIGGGAAQEETLSEGRREREREGSEEEPREKDGLLAGGEDGEAGD